MLMKIDVEGHEVPVLRSLQQTLTSRWPLVFCEVVDAHLQRAGYSAALVREQLEQHGLEHLQHHCSADGLVELEHVVAGS
ncbi:MAG TPA: hypothetical protein EYP98_19145, partial [Planctomycetes bacterium]|nr:hypothetical protein [Planctomycetota bacterium]